MPDFRSDKSIPAEDRLIMALNVPGMEQARQLINRLGDTVRFYKLRLELFMAGDYFALIDWLQAREKEIFVDLKVFDVPATVARAVRALSGRGCSSPPSTATRP